MNSFNLGTTGKAPRTTLWSAILAALVSALGNNARADSHLISDEITLQSGSVCAGSQAMYGLLLTRAESGKLPVSLSAQNLPSGIMATFVPQVVEFGSNDRTANGTMNLMLGQNVAPGSYSFAVVAKAGGLNNSLTNIVTIEVGMCSPGIAKMNDGCVCLAFETIPGQKYLIQATPDLTNPIWTGICTTNMVGNLLVFADMDSTNYPMRFYRSALVQ